MVIFDKPMPVRLHGGRRAHVAFVVSDIPGNEGTSELLSIAPAVGLNPGWLRDAGTYNEHFQVIGRKIEKLRDAGAQEVSRDYIQQVLRSKRNGHQQ